MPLEMKKKPATKFRVRCDMGTRLRAALPGSVGEIAPCMKRGPWRKQPWRARLDAEKRGFKQIEPGVMVCPKHGGGCFIAEMREKRLAREARKKSAE